MPIASSKWGPEELLGDPQTSSKHLNNSGGEEQVGSSRYVYVMKSESGGSKGTHSHTPQISSSVPSALSVRKQNVILKKTTQTEESERQH